jgi:threonine dehydratase
MRSPGSIPAPGLSSPRPPGITDGHSPSPENAPRTKLDAIRALGADLRLCADYDDAERCAKEHGRRGDATYISPYSHADIVAGAGTTALEILEERGDVARIVVPIGGGGLISGIAIAAAGLDPQVRVIGVEAEASQPFTQGRAAGRIVEIDVQPTLADGLSGNLDPETITFAIVQRLVPEIAVVSESEIRDAMRDIVQREHLIAEGAAAVGIAAVASGKIKPNGRPLAVVLSGANVDVDVLKSILT